MDMHSAHRNIFNVHIITMKIILVKTEVWTLHKILDNTSASTTVIHNINNTLTHHISKNSGELKSGNFTTSISKVQLKHVKLIK